MIMHVCQQMINASLIISQTKNKELNNLIQYSAFAGTAAVRCDVAAPAITRAKLQRNVVENVTFTG